MVKEESRSVSNLRDMFDYRDEFDVVLACGFKLSERFDFYDGIGEVIKRVGKRPYLPHKEIDLDWPPEKIFDITNRIVIPCSDIVIGYLGLKTDDVGLMVGAAFNYNIPVSYLYGESGIGLDGLGVNLTNIGSSNSSVVDLGWRGEICDLIEFEDEIDALNKIGLSLEAFYDG